MEQLLTRLIELGWKPFGQKCKCLESVFKKSGVCFKVEVNTNEYRFIDFSRNNLCSLDSGLRQFVCEKGLYGYVKSNYSQLLEIEYIHPQKGAFITDYKKKEYRLMLSSIQEDKEKFIMENIILPITPANEKTS